MAMERMEVTAGLLVLLTSWKKALCRLSTTCIWERRSFNVVWYSGIVDYPRKMWITTGTEKNKRNLESDLVFEVSIPVFWQVGD